MLRQVSLCAMLLVSMVSCKTKHELEEGESYLWVYSLKEPCGVADKHTCYRIKTTEIPDSSKWEVSDLVIDGFEYEEGYIYRLAVSVDTVSSDSVRITLSEVVNKIVDQKLALQHIWEVNAINARPLEVGDSSEIPQIEFRMRQMKMAGFDGCNFIQGVIEGAGNKKIDFGPVARTIRACSDMKTADLFRHMLDSVETYEVKEDELRFFNSEGKEILAFTKVK